VYKTKKKTDCNLLHFSRRLFRNKKKKVLLLQINYRMFYIRQTTKEMLQHLLFKDTGNHCYTPHKGMGDFMFVFCINICVSHKISHINNHLQALGICEYIKRNAGFLLFHFDSFMNHTVMRATFLKGKNNYYFSNGTK
jgi:hypothetical protein